MMISKKYFNWAKKSKIKIDRSILVEFKNTSLKNYFIESLPKLANTEDIYKQLSVTYDLPKSERSEVKKLVGEAKELQKGEGEFVNKVRGKPGTMKIMKLRKR